MISLNNNVIITIIYQIIIIIYQINLLCKLIGRKVSPKLKIFAIPNYSMRSLIWEGYPLGASALSLSLVVSLSRLIF